MSANYQHSTSDTQQQQEPEWIPCWLRKSRALSVAAFCIVFAVCLEIFNTSVDRNNGLSVGPHNAISVNAARYLPTCGAVCLGFMWKALVQDTKKITPWSTMSGKWSKTSDSLGLDYITAIEAFVLFKAVSRRHWAVFTGILLGFVRGALVAVANSLTYVDLFATHSEATHLLKTTTFSYSGISPKPDGTLPIPYTHLGQNPYAAIAAERLPGGQSAPWSKDNYVFESFGSSAQVSGNTTIQATVQAFYPNFTCHLFDFILPDSKDTAFYLTLRGNVSSRPELNCSNDVLLDHQREKYQPGVKSWLNTTACADNRTDIRILSILAWYGHSLTLERTLGVLCRPSFMTTEAEVRADWVTGDVLEYNIRSSPRIEQSIETSTDAIYAYLNNPLDSRTLMMYTETADFEDGICLNNTQTAISNFETIYGIDPFSEIITNHLSDAIINAFRKDPEQYRMAVEQLSNGIMSQVFNAFSRESSSQTIDGILKIAEPQMFLRQQSLRILQALLCLLALTCILQISILRPRTRLIEDPGPIASMAVLLATCEDYVSDVLSLETHSTDKRTETTLESFMWQLQATIHQTPALMAIPKHSSKPNASGTRNDDGFRPLSLRLWAKLAVSGALLAVMAAGLIILFQSRRNNGIYNDTAIASTISRFVPTVILLLLGYACSGIDSSVRTMTPYRALSTKRDGTGSPLLFNIRDVPSIWMPFRALKNHLGSAVFASSFAILLIPPLKITTAGLYRVGFVQTKDSIRAEVDIGLIDNLIGTLDDMHHRAQAPSPNEIIQSASKYAEWALNPDFNIPIRSGILENLVFSNITALSGFTGDEESLSRGEVTARVPAIAVDVKCNTASLELYGTYHNCPSGQPWITFDLACSTLPCNSTINGTSPSLLRLSMGSKSKECSKQNSESRFAGDTYVDSDLGYQVFLVHWGDAVGYVANKTRMPFRLNNDSMENYQKVLLEPGMLNISFPEIRAVNCYSNLTRVTVNTTFTRTKGTGWHNITLSSWSPSRYDITSLNRETQYNRSKLPYWLAPYAAQRAWGSTGYPFITERNPEFSDSLWPKMGGSGTFFQLLASYGEYTLGNISSILDPDNFVQASTAMYTAYTVNLLTELRPFAINASSGIRNSTQTIEAEAVYPSARITQDFATTIASECLLLVMFLCFAWVSFRFPSHAILPKNPGSIAAQASLLANSRLVERLRDGNVRSVKEAEHIWQEKAGLGWWPSRRIPLEQITNAAEGGIESDTSESVSGCSEETDNEPGAVVDEGRNERIESGDIENGDIDNGDVEYGAVDEEGDESSEFRTRVVDRTVETAQGEQGGRVESAREAERLLDHTGEQPDTRPSDKEATLNGEDSVEHGLRWGIDIGEGMIKGSWRQPPESDRRV